MPGGDGAAHRLHHQRQDPGPVGGQHIRQQLVSQHGGVGPVCPGTGHGGLQSLCGGLSRMALIGHAQVGAEFRHPPAGAVVGHDHKADAVSRQVRDPVPERLVGVGRFLRGQGEIQVAEQQCDSPLREVIRGNVRVTVEHAVRHKGKRHRRLLLCIKSLRVSYQIFRNDTRGSGMCNCILP